MDQQDADRDAAHDERCRDQGAGVARRDSEPRKQRQVAQDHGIARREDRREGLGVEAHFGGGLQVEARRHHHLQRPDPARRVDRHERDGIGIALFPHELRERAARRREIRNLRQPLVQGAEE
jgi:hypothetical protein